jgi:peptidoglycan/xylan/chitin deacetylase (PgdA/CDA1 family)
MFQAYKLPCTVFAAAMALERNPTVCATIREQGYEVCGHGWRWSEDWTVDREEEQARITQATASIAQHCGERPIGWYSRWMPSEHTRELLVREGGFIYDSNAYNDDLPYYVSVAGKAHLVIPYTLTYNDARYTSPGFGPTDFVDICCRGIDELWIEGQTRPRMMSIGLHARLSGQAGRASALREVIEHALGKGDIWFTRRADIARWWLDKQPRERVVVLS